MKKLYFYVSSKFSEFSNESNRTSKSLVLFFLVSDKSFTLRIRHSSGYLSLTTYIIKWY